MLQGALTHSMNKRLYATCRCGGIRHQAPCSCLDFPNVAAASRVLYAVAAGAQSPLLSVTLLMKHSLNCVDEDACSSPVDLLQQSDTHPVTRHLYPLVKLAGALVHHPEHQW